MWFFRRILDDELIDFLLQRLDSAGMEELDGHEPLDFAVDYYHPRPNVGHSFRFLRGCGACSRDPIPYDNGTFGFRESLIESWPCLHVRSLALAFADDTHYQESWRS
ncbi:hypothetical protein [Streptomyces chartreusis]|uniref:hypothetical protein n=1 Tax=Streptomyces chartreusis TaxID=1969 RepID=UPI002E819E4F|nr:hypothetical protein [Streptomyces chartreusis]WUB23826.1 hypothetical protein OG997_44655 [Streptomyces chartreusis]